MAASGTDNLDVAAEVVPFYRHTMRAERHEVLCSGLAWLPAIALVVLLGLTVLDLVYAVGALPCHVSPGDGCYPWGTEGPVTWIYRSKERYLASGFVGAAVCIAGLVALARLSWRVGGMVASVALGVWISLHFDFG